MQGGATYQHTPSLAVFDPLLDKQGADSNNLKKIILTWIRFVRVGEGDAEDMQRVCMQRACRVYVGGYATDHARLSSRRKSAAGGTKCGRPCTVGRVDLVMFHQSRCVKADVSPILNATSLSLL